MYRLYRLCSVLGSWAGCVQCLECTVHYSTQQTMTSAGLGWGSAAQCTAVRVVTSDRLHSLVSCTHQHLHSHNWGLTNSNKIPLLYNSDCYNSSKILQVKFQVWLQCREEPHFRVSAWSVPLQTPVTLCCIIYGQEQKLWCAKIP